jgi:hypothetical protein
MSEYTDGHGGEYGRDAPPVDAFHLPHPRLTPEVLVDFNGATCSRRSCVAAARMCSVFIGWEREESVRVAEAERARAESAFPEAREQAPAESAWDR